MSIIKEIKIDGQPVAFKASAAVPRMYRLKFRRDIFQDMTNLQKDMGESDSENSTLSVESLEMFENVAYIMAKHADSSVPNSIDEWLENFETFSIYQVLPQILELWKLNTESFAQSKKNKDKLTVK
jgi:flavorubredoxin